MGIWIQGVKNRPERKKVNMEIFKNNMPPGIGSAISIRMRIRIPEISCIADPDRHDCIVNFYDFLELFDDDSI